MKKYYVAVCSTFNGINTIYAVMAVSNEEAQVKAMRLAGWECESVKDFTSIEDIVSNAVEVLK
jgi:hypothetical protein